MKANSQKFNSGAGFSDFLLAKNSGMKKSRAADSARFSFGLFSKPILRITALILLFTMSTALLRGVGGTVAYLSDNEISNNNEFTAGTLDFSLDTAVATNSICAATGNPLEKSIHFNNFGNPFRYTASSSNISGDVCDYVNLIADINGGDPEYTGPIKDFDYGLTEFSDPTDWTFNLSFATDIPAELEGQICTFSTDFKGQQTRHNLTFPTGFSDFETFSTEVQAPYCNNYEIRSHGYWKTHPEIYRPHLPQFIGATITDEFGNAAGTDEIINTQTQVYDILSYNGSDMRDILKKQLLAMKFNIFHFYVDSYVPDGGTDTLESIVEQADALLRQTPEPPREELEAMKNLLDITNNLVSVRICKSCEPPPPPDACAMRITKTADKAEVAPGEEITYHLTLDNYGTKVCTGGGVRIKDTYTSALEYLSYTSNRQPGGFNQSTGYLEWNFGNVYPNDPLIEIDLKMKVKTQAQCDSTLTNTAKFWSNQTNWGAPVTAESTVVCEPAPESEAGNIVINEFLPNPRGDDDAPKPGGEWVELYNTGDSAVDVNGWALYDNNNSHKLLITTSNTDTGETIIAPDEFLVVYRNGDSDFALNNEHGDSVRLFDGKISDGANLIDSYTYTEDALEGKSFARIPDGSTNWVDPIPTPGEENSLVGADIVFGPAIAEEGEDGYIAPAPVIAPTETGGNPPNPLYQGGGDNDPALIPDTAPAETPVSDAEQISTTTPADISAPETTASDQPTEPAAEPTTTTEQPTTPTNPSDTTLITQPLAPIPPELILPEAPIVTDTDSGS